MKSKINILFIAVLLVFASSCTKFTPLERVSDGDNVATEKGNKIILKVGSSNDMNDTNSDSSITDPGHDEDFDADINITDTDNDEDYDKDKNGK